MVQAYCLHGWTVMHSAAHILCRRAEFVPRNVGMTGENGQKNGPDPPKWLPWSRESFQLHLSGVSISSVFTRLHQAPPGFTDEVLMGMNACILFHGDGRRWMEIDGLMEIEKAWWKFIEYRLLKILKRLFCPSPTALTAIYGLSDGWISVQKLR